MAFELKNLIPFSDDKGGISADRAYHGETGLMFKLPERLVIGRVVGKKFIPNLTTEAEKICIQNKLNYDRNIVITNNYISLALPNLDKYHCPVCREVLVRPLQTLCGHSICTVCWRRLEKPRNCPTCRTPAKVFHDRRLERELNEIIVKCPFDDCKWLGNYGKLIKHLSDNCEYCYTSCPECSADILHSERDGHAKRCPMWFVDCERCGIHCRRKDMPAHQQMHNDVVECRICREKMPAMMLADHLTNEHYSDGKSVMPALNFTFF